MNRALSTLARLVRNTGTEQAQRILSGPFVQHFSLSSNSNARATGAASNAARPVAATNKQSSLVSLDEKNVKNVIERVSSNVLTNQKHSRLFAVVMVGGSQYKITTDDTIVVRNHFYPTIGDKIRLEKVLMIGGKDFSVIGKPLLSKQFVRVEATVVEKTLSNNVIIHKYKPRRDNKKMDFFRGILTVLRINSIEILDKVPES